MSHPTRHVTIERDRGSVLWFLRCVTPCGHCSPCWLGSAFTAKGAAAYALSLGYTVEAAP